MGNGDSLSFVHWTLGQTQYRAPFMYHKVRINSVRDVEHWKSVLKEESEGKRQEVLKYLLLPLGYEIVEGDACQHLSFINLKFDDYPFSLEQQIHQRNKTGKVYTLQQINVILKILLLLVNQFQGDNKKVGDIRTKNVLLDANGRIAVIARLSWPCELTNFQKMHQTKDCGYLSPQQLVELRNKNFFPRLNEAKTEVFSIGMTVLEVASLQSSSELYQDLEIKQELLDSRVKQTKKRYGAQLGGLLAQMLAFKAELRPKPAEALQTLSAICPR